jgi:hypothetical protein
MLASEPHRRTTGEVLSPASAPRRTGPPPKACVLQPVSADGPRIGTTRCRCRRGAAARGPVGTWARRDCGFGAPRRRRKLDGAGTNGEAVLVVGERDARLAVLANLRGSLRNAADRQSPFGARRPQQALRLSAASASGIEPSPSTPTTRALPDRASTPTSREAS